MSARTFGEKNNNNKVASFDVIFDVNTDEDKEKELGRRISLEEKDKSFIAAVSK